MRDGLGLVLVFALIVGGMAMPVVFVEWALGPAVEAERARLDAELALREARWWCWTFGWERAR